MSILSRGLLCAALFIAVGAPEARAQGEDFNAVVQEAMKDYRARRYDAAIQKFERAYAISPQPELIYNVARANEKSLKREAAIAAYERFLSLEGTTADLRAKALESLTALRREKEAMRRSQDVGKAPPPTAVAPPAGTGAAAGVTRPAPEPKSRTLEWVLIGGGAAVAATGAVFGVLALQASSDFDQLKEDGADRATLEDKKSTVDNNALAADVLIGVGAVSAIAGVILLLTGDDEPEVAVAPVFGKDYAAVGFSGHF